jgi:hypothetical protein
MKLIGLVILDFIKMKLLPKNRMLAGLYQLAKHFFLQFMRSHVHRFNAVHASFHDPSKGFVE